jgi:two-component system, OmpR family, KDP operon response regulator KdpE
VPESSATTVEQGGPTLLLIEDDAGTRREVARNLTAHGYRVVEAATAAEALSAWERGRPDLLLVDLGLPDRDGISVVRRVRREATTPIVVVSAMGDEQVKVTALEAGADDYVTKPFGSAELLARIRAVLRRTGGAAGDSGGVISNGTIRLDPVTHQVHVGAGLLVLTPREFRILEVLLSQPGRLVTRGRILRAVWGEAYQDQDHYIHVYVSQLRRKIATLDPDGALHDLITAEPGVGYRVRST